jgi:uncharacterized membrane protein
VTHQTNKNMKMIKLTFLIIVFGTPLLVFGQTTPKFVYCEIVGTEKLLSTKVTITVDFGQKMKFFADNRMKDETGKPLVFNSMIDALNFMGKQGWEFAQAYTITISSQNVYHFLMKKPFDELDDEVKTEFLKN